MNEKALFNINYGLYVLTASSDGFDNGCIVNTVMQVTNTPNRILIALNKENFTTKMIQKSMKFNVSVISEKADFSLISRFGFSSGAKKNKFEGFDKCKRGGNGILYVNDSINAYICCTVEKVEDVGTHMLFVALVDDCDVMTDDASMSYEYYLKNVKPTPTETHSDGKVWVCKICGYVYDDEKEKVKFEDLPNNWVCPLCKHPKSDFELRA